MRRAVWSLVLAVPAFLVTSPLYADGIPDDGVRVLLRGPVHEAFAQPVNLTPQAGPIAPKQPPDPVAELPPDERPAGDSVVWIPGYWSWDNDSASFIWVSGFWRLPPPGRVWVPGYWAPTVGGWQWVSGYWMPVGQDSMLFRAVPPATLEAGPTVAAPDADSIYAPGCWLWNQSRYVWRPGCWTPGQANWVWVPAQYYWTPAGYAFVNGYWDYPLEQRGMLLAPVAFDRPVFAAPGWRYRPTCAVNLAGLFGSLFIRPAYGCYYFGDYYGPECLRAGFQPWCVYGPRCYDPLFSYCRWSHRDFPDWHAGLLRLYDGRLKGQIPLPPRTLALQNRFIGDHAGDPRLLHNTSDIVRRDARSNDILLHQMLTPLGQIKRVEGRDLSLVKVSPAERDRFMQSTRDFRKVVDDRRGTELSTVRVEDHRTPDRVTIKTGSGPGSDVRITNTPTGVHVSPTLGSTPTHIQTNNPTINSTNIPATHPASQPTVTRSSAPASVAAPTHTASPTPPAAPAHTAAPIHTPPPPHNPPSPPPPPQKSTNQGTKSSSNPATKAAPHQSSAPKEHTRSVRTTAEHSAPARSAPTHASSHSAPAHNSGSHSSSAGHSSSSDHSGKR